MLMREYGAHPGTRATGWPAPVEGPDNVTQTVSEAATSQQSAPLQATTDLLLLRPQATCWAAFGPNPTAVVGQGRWLPANEERYVQVERGAGWRVAIILDA